MKENQSQCFSNLKNDQMKNLIKCMVVTRACGKKCVDEGNKESAALCFEAAEICDLAIKFTCSNSPFKHQVMHLCDEICKKCAEKCEKMQADHCKECAEICKACCETCTNEHSSSCSSCCSKSGK